MSDSHVMQLIRLELIDTHCHLTAINEQQLSVVLDNAAKCSVTRFITIGAGVGSASGQKAVALTERFSNIWASVGVHPHDAGKAKMSELASLVTHSKVVAIGETGLDFFRDWAPKHEQEACFRETITLAKKIGKPIIIHCRDAREEVWKILVEENGEQVGGVFHCFSEDEDFAAKVCEMNFRVSFTGNITFKKAERLREAVKKIPLTQILLETDTPYMAPEPFRGKPSEPMHVYTVAQCIANIKGLTIDEVAGVTTANARELFRF